MLAVSQLHALLFFLIGIINKRSAPNNPIEVSLIFKSKLLLINLLKIHNKAVNKNTIATIFSAKEAAEELEKSKLPFILFKIEEKKGVNIVFRRKDGNIGWVQLS